MFISGSNEKYRQIWAIVLLCILLGLFGIVLYSAHLIKNFPINIPGTVRLEKYSGPVHHIFFHSLIIYPEKAIADTGHARLYANNMITTEQFKLIIQKLYENHFILIDSRELYSFDADGTIHKKILSLPEGKIPLVLSMDDLAYYETMKNGGFANKLVVDNGQIKTEVITPEGQTIITDDGDLVPIIDNFIKTHPDFSFEGAKGILGVTGYDGILGYRTQLQGPQGDEERAQAKIVVDALKADGWIFASHSFSHEVGFLRATISTTTLAADIEQWKNQVEPLIGSTNIYIGPFGTIFKDGDERRNQLINAGFTVLYGVGMDENTTYFKNYVTANRVNIDGYRLAHNADRLHQLFGF